MSLMYEQVEFDQSKANKNMEENDWSKKIKDGKGSDNVTEKEDK